jgi:hypothetical protein
MKRQHSTGAVKSRPAPLLIMAILFAVVGIAFLALTFAATDGQAKLEAETASSELAKDDDAASGGKYIEFAGEVVDPPDDPPGDFPIAGHNGSVGCRQNCQEVGFQNLDGKDGVTLENLIISNPGDKCMSINGAKNITIRNVTVQNCATEVTLSGSGSGHNPIIPIIGSSNITIENSVFKNIARKESTRNRNNLFAVENTNNFIFRNNEVRDLHTDLNAGGANGGGGSLDYGNRLFRLVKSLSNITIERNSFFNPGRNVLQIARSTIPNFLFAHNRIEGRGEWDSDFEDILNFYQASGTSGSPLVVRGNYIKNGSPSINGTTMALGDGGGQAAEYMLVEDNVLLNPGKVGIGLSGGQYFTVRNNTILGDVNVPINLNARFAEAVGMHIMDLDYTPYCGDHTITGNRILYKNQTKASGYGNLYFPKNNNQSCDGPINFSGNIIPDNSLKREDIWPF